MNTVEPIRKEADREALEEYLQKRSARDHLLVVMGIDTGLRIGDQLRLRVRDVTDCVRIEIRESKRHKAVKRKITPKLRRVLTAYCEDRDGDEYLFKSRNGYNRPISRERAYRIIREAAEAVGLKNIACHSLRKTFGWIVYEKTKDPSLVQEFLNHSTPKTTRRYIGINQDVMDRAMDRFR